MSSRSNCQRLFFAALFVTLSACQTKKETPKPEPTGKATLIGVVEMVNPEQNYVLIRCEPMPNLPPGTELMALGSDGRRAKLVLTPERKGFYATADIKEGFPAVTNLVLIQRGESPPAVSDAEKPSAPSPAPVATPATTSSPYVTLPVLPGVIPNEVPSATQTGGEDVTLPNGPLMPLDPPSGNAAPVIPAVPPPSTPAPKAKNDLDELLPAVGGAPPSFE